METLYDEQIDFLEIFNIKQQDGQTVLEFKKILSNFVIFDPGLYHTAICKSTISKVDKKDGRLSYRGTPVEEKIYADYLDVAFEIIFGIHCDLAQKKYFKNSVFNFFKLYPEMQLLLENISRDIHPMHFLSMGVISLSAIESKYLKNPNDPIEKAAFLIAQVGIIVSYYVNKLNNQGWQEKKAVNSYAYQILTHMQKIEDSHRLKKLAEFLNTVLILHCEHGQNCSAATVRNIASAKADLYSAVSCGIAAFNGKLHGGASEYVSQMYDYLLSSGEDVNEYIDKKIAQKEPVMGFGQRTYNRIYNCWDPRVETMYNILYNKEFNFVEVEEYKNLASKLMNRILNDEYYKKRNITPNPDLFNCIFYKLFGVPSQMNATMIALGRVAGWIANYFEHLEHRYPLTRPCDL